MCDTPSIDDTDLHALYDAALPVDAPGAWIRRAIEEMHAPAAAGEQLRQGATPSSSAPDTQ